MTEELPAEPPAAPPAVRADQDPGQEADGQPSPRSPLPEDTKNALIEGEAGELDEGEELDEETMQLLQEMREQEAEMEAILHQHHSDAADLLRIRDAMATELQQLKEESWRLEAVQDLELMRGRLEGMLELPDAPESASAEAPESGATVAVAAGGEPAAAGQGDMEAMLQWEEDALDQELLSLRAQLKDIKLQAAEMDNRRQALMEELNSIEVPEQWNKELAAAAEE
mmetsp:Transcript_10799/g.27716  ORF Transcript_10799/g.27716 Transcript_10799/m.27716 type:complete len:227 (+) Transcript_10799:142-822(+)